MYLQQLNLENYKCFYDKVSLNFEPGFNILLGANSSGKTAVLDACGLSHGSGDIHRSLMNTPTENIYRKNSVDIQFVYSYTFEELRKEYGGDILFFLKNQIAGLQTIETLKPIIEKKLNDEAIKLITTFQNQNPIHEQIFESDFITHINESIQSQCISAFEINSQNNNLTRYVPGIESTQSLPHNLHQIWYLMNQKIYKFAVDRKVQSAYQHTTEIEILKPDCSNLALCLANLSNKRRNIFDQFNALVNRVFPNISATQGELVGTSQFHLKIYTHDTNIYRPDLTYDINQVGTGVGHVMSMIYVALTSKTPRIILLEEPNSFLHPRALKELLAILRDVGGHHQYIISTHSSDVLRAIEPSTVTLLENDGQQSQARQTNKQNMHELRSGLIDLGIRLTDLHGCDRVLWVEGQTEEAVFPYLLSHFFPDQAQGISILKVYATGDFEAKKFDASKVAEIYQKLCTLNSLAPPMVAITLDREDRTQKYIEEIEKTPKNIIKFLPRRMLEDYFLDADAIKFVLREIATKAIDFNEVSKALSQAQLNISNQQKIKHTKDTYTHSAKVLKEVFWELAQTEYNKIKHGTLIAQYLLKHKQETLYELRDWFNKFIHLP